MVSSIVGNFLAAALARWIGYRRTIALLCLIYFAVDDAHLLRAARTTSAMWFLLPLMGASSGRVRPVHDVHAAAVSRPCCGRPAPASATTSVGSRPRSARCSSACSAPRAAITGSICSTPGFLFVPAAIAAMFLSEPPDERLARRAGRIGRHDEHRSRPCTQTSARTSPAEDAAAVVGEGAFRYRADAAWEQLPEGWTLVEVAGVAPIRPTTCSSSIAALHPVIVFDRHGKFVRSWGEGMFIRPHGIHVGPDDAVYCVDDADHTVRKFTPDGRLLLTLGTSGQRLGNRGVHRRLSDDRALRRAVQSADEPGAGGRRSIFSRRRLRQCPRAPFQSRRPAGRVLGRAGRGPWPVSRAARHRDRRRGHGLCGRPRE